MPGRQMHRLEEDICKQILVRHIEMVQEVSSGIRYATIFKRRGIDRKRLNLRIGINIRMRI